MKAKQKIIAAMELDFKGLSTRAFRILIENGLLTWHLIGTALELEELQHADNCGPKTVKEIREWLATQPMPKAFDKIADRLAFETKINRGRLMGLRFQLANAVTLADKHYYNLMNEAQRAQWGFKSE